MEVSSSESRYRVVGVVDEGIRCTFSPGRHLAQRCPRQEAFAVEHCGAFAAADVPAFIRHVRWRPATAIDPLVLAHQEDSDGRFTRYSVVDAFHPAVKPADGQIEKRLQTQLGLTAKILGSNDGSAIQLLVVNPGTDDQVLGGGMLPFTDNPRVGIQAIRLDIVVPSDDMEYRNIYVVGCGSETLEPFRSFLSSLEEARQGGGSKNMTHYLAASLSRWELKPPDVDHVPSQLFHESESAAPGQKWNNFCPA